MWKRITLVILALVSVGVVMACPNKTPKPNITSPLTLIVMDTTQALLQGAEVEIGKTVLRTSWDGRLVLQPEQLANVKQLKVACQGYETKKMALENAPVILVQLTPKPQKNVHGGDGDDRVYYTLRGRELAKGVSAVHTMAVMEDAMPEMTGMLPSAGGSGANHISAGLLTAGEVNDFTQWSFWPNVLDGSHAKFVKTWGIEPRNRYTVQVVNKNGYPIVNYPVNLTDVKGNTLFQTVTDNTGKAELWFGLTGERKNGVIVKEPKKTIFVEDDEPCEASDGVDVMFVFDATGSMGDELRYLQEEMKDVISRATEATGGLKIRTGAVVYRDHGDEYVTRISRLTDQITTTQAFIDKQEANGGGDYPEAVPEALMAALNSAGWDNNARTRIAFLILDAPCHEDSATLALLHEQVLNAAAMGVRIVPVVCSGLGESGEYLLRSIALATNGTSFFLTDDSGIGNTHLKPTSDSLVVEHLNDMLVRTIVEFSYMPDCMGKWNEEEIANVREEFIPNPFTEQDIEKDASLPHGPTTLYLLDVSGKLITIYQGTLEGAGDSQLSSLGIYLPTGIYFVKAFYNGEWHTKKILVH